MLSYFLLVRLKYIHILLKKNKHCCENVKKNNAKSIRRLYFNAHTLKMSLSQERFCGDINHNNMCSETQLQYV